MLAGIDQLGLFIVTGLLLNLMPGPDVLYIVSQGLRGGRAAGLVAALGITAGCFVHMAAATLGLGALVAASATAFTVLKWVGAAYLVYVGVAMLHAPPVAPLPGLAGGGLSAPTATSLRKVFAQGFWTNTLNPKVALFFLAFLPQFIHPQAQHKTLTFLLLGLVFIVNSVPVNMAYGWGAAWLASRLSGQRSPLNLLNRGAGALFVYFGVRLALSERTLP
ncbi:MAG: LysE family translocator [Rhodoferax sp.]|jgi:threonine/homoserine/homoserine lactone efflux protein|nr:LysE family translocator [Rhodoferax sp.]